jgi:hypothetical protein
MTLRPLYQTNKMLLRTIRTQPMKQILKQPHFNPSVQFYRLKSLDTLTLQQHPPPPPEKLVLFEFQGSNNLQLGEKTIKVYK